MKWPDWLPVYGDTKYRDKKCPSEDAEQITFFNQIRNIEPCAIHVKNEGKRHCKQAAKDKANGLVKGAPDIWIPGKQTFLCELKRQDHTLCKLGDDQIEFLANARDGGAFVCVALGYKAAIEAYNEWKK